MGLGRSRPRQPSHWRVEGWGGCGLSEVRRRLSDSDGRRRVIAKRAERRGARRRGAGGRTRPARRAEEGTGTRAEGMLRAEGMPRAGRRAAGGMLWRAGPCIAAVEEDIRPWQRVAQRSLAAVPDILRAQLAAAACDSGAFGYSLDCKPGCAPVKGLISFGDSFGEQSN